MKNPAAFPRPIGNNGVNEYSEGQPGMTLRDYFAGQAMIGFASGYELSYENIAYMAYKQADAMLEEREKDVE